MCRSTALALATLLLTPATPGKAKEPYAELAGVTVISGSDSGSVPVLVPVGVSVQNPILSRSSMSVRGSGDVVGFVLIEAAHTDGRMYFGGRLKGFLENRPFVMPLSDDVAVPERVTIPKGKYLLYLIPGEETVRIKLVLGELDGRVSLSPVNDATVVTRAPAPVRPQPLYAAGADGRLDGYGALIGLTWLESEAHGTTRADFCQSRGTTPSDWMYLPGQDECNASDGPGGGEAWTDFGTSPSHSHSARLYHARWENLRVRKPKASYQHSITLETASLAPSIGSAFLWLTYS